MRGHRISFAAIATERFWQVAVLTAAGAIGCTSSAEAAVYYWGDSDPGYYRPGPPVQPRRPRARRNAPDKTMTAAEKDTGAKPVGPLIIAISIEKQKLKVYDANGFFAESPVSTGTKSHPTPMGVFSIIQKHKLHHSNIYSGAPMPFMQRITWSGVAMHAGVLPGYPASHGCIRLPMAFAAKMWNWTKMGARVVVTPGEITPAQFAHPLLAEKKVVPQPVAAAEEPTIDATAKADKGADAAAPVKPAISEAKLELRSTVGHDDVKQTRTADASAATNVPVTMSDAGSSAASTADHTAHAEVKSEAAATEADPSKADDPLTLALELAQAAGTEAPASENAQAGPPPGEAKIEAGTEATAEAAKPETPKADATKSAEKADAKPDASITATAPPAAAPDVKKDQTRLSNTDKVAKPEPPKRPGQIAVLISRKDGKLYVRENFKPLFDVPVTIAPSDRLLGTHVFTAAVDKTDPNVLRWSVVSLPVSARNAQKNDDDERSSRRRKIAGAVPLEMKPAPVPNSPAEALDRISVPSDAMARITEALTTGGSIVVSDQGINQGGETGEGTDFIVSLR